MAFLSPELMRLHKFFQSQDARASSPVVEEVVEEMPAQQPPIPKEGGQAVATETQSVPMSPAPQPNPQDLELRQLQAEREAKLKPYLDSQEQGVRTLESELAKLQNMPQEWNFAPLLAYADQLSKGNALAGYKAPKSAQERQKEVIEIQNLIQKSRGDLTQTQIKALSDKISEKLTSDGNRQKRFETSMGLKTREGLFNKFQSDKTAMNARESITGAKNARALLDSGTPVGDRGFTVALARAAGEKGPLSETDVNTWAGSPAVAARINRELEKIKTGRLSEVDRKDMYKIIDIMEKRQKATLNSRINYFSNNIAPKVYGIDSDSALEILGSVDDVSSDLNVSSGGLTPEEQKELQELEKKHGK